MADQNEENGNNLQSVDGNLEVEEDEEDEDVDFNPFLRGDMPSEASSSLSSEEEGADNTNRKSIHKSLNAQEACMPPIMMDVSRIPQVDSQVGGHSENNDANCSIREEDLCEPVVGVDVEDAISKRTRARHSLANYTLEELETFLQESDDECDLPNVNDEEEYHKFLHAVLLGGSDEVQAGREEGTMDDDEEDDADFELEIQEALESDDDEYAECNGRKVDKTKKGSRIPETRHKKRQKESVKDMGKQFVSPSKPLRPIFTSKPVPMAAPLPYECQFPLPNSAHFSAAAAAESNGFTAPQLGQLYCLIHEHVQLLIQIFSVSVLDPSKQQVADAAGKMILEINNRREEALSQRNIYSSLQFEFQQNAESSNWAPFMENNSVLSILDVAPLRLVKSYMTDVSNAVKRYRERYRHDVAEAGPLIRQPLFPLPTLSSVLTMDDASGGTTGNPSNGDPDSPYSPGQVQPKGPRKSLAATIVETTKKQSVALVPKDIAVYAQRFYPLFNAELFPYKPPLPSVANRVLFTDAEDRLLATGIMNYNNDWAAIQQHYLPCKSEHQIFVRQKNRSSSNAPENPIKDVRRMKTSPLTTHEQALISEGLKCFKEDWSLVWKICVPYRDPSLLPRQWRIASGTHKSYKKGEASKEKRRLYELERRKRKASLANHQIPAEEINNVEDKSADDNDGECEEAYVHEAFLDDSERGSSKTLPCDNFPFMTVNGLPYAHTYISEPKNSVMNDAGQPRQRTERSSYMRGRKGARVVKLAPNLRPVNLPRSVRVISESAFKSYNSVPSSSKICSNPKEYNVAELPQVSRVVTSRSTPGEYLNNCSDTRFQQGEITRASSLGTEENNSDSDLRMHPLLFQASEVQSSLCPVENHQNISSRTYIFLPGHRFQANANVECPPVNLVDYNTEQTEVPSSVGTIDFHPLLQKDSSTMPSTYRQYLSTPQSSHQSDCNLRVATVGNDNLTASRTSLRLYEKNKNLDLNICLSSTPENEIPEGGASPSRQEIVKDGLDSDVMPDKAGGHQHMMDLQDDSVCGIVMEQEELSDSEEEIENVEFECEEIDDSEEDELEREQPPEIQNKEFSFFASNKEEGKCNDKKGPTLLMFLGEGSARKDDKSTNAKQISEDSCLTKSSRLKVPCNSAAKKKRTCRPSKKQTTESSKRQAPSKPTRKKDAAVPSKRPRKQSVSFNIS